MSGKFPINIHMIDHVVIRTNELAKMISFYRDILGCSVERELDELGLVQLRAGKSLVDLVDVGGPIGKIGGDAPRLQARNMDHFCLQVEPFDADAITSHLKAHGIEVGDIETRYGARGFGPSIYIKDPEHNTVELKGPPQE